MSPEDLQQIAALIAANKESLLPVVQPAAQSAATQPEKKLEQTNPTPPAVAQTPPRSSRPSTRLTPAPAPSSNKCGGTMPTGTMTWRSFTALRCVAGFFIRFDGRTAFLAFGGRVGDLLATVLRR